MLVALWLVIKGLHGTQRQLELRLLLPVLAMHRAAQGLRVVLLDANRVLVLGLPQKPGKIMRSAEPGTGQPGDQSGTALSGVGGQCAPRPLTMTVLAGES